MPDLLTRMTEALKEARKTIKYWSKPGTEVYLLNDIDALLDEAAQPKGEAVPVAWGVVHHGRVLFAHEQRQQCENMRALGNPNATVEPLYLTTPKSEDTK